MKIHVIDEERTTMTEEVSVSKSDASSKGSNHCQHPLLEFVEAACVGSSWFTSCFPCAIVTINDSNDVVVSKLSRESAMNAMYSRNCTSATDTPISNEERPIKKGSEQDLTVTEYQHRRKTEHEFASLCESDAPVTNTRSLVKHSSEGVEFTKVASTVTPNDDTGSMPVAGSDKREDLSSVSSVDMKPICSVPRKKNNCKMKLFGRKKSESSQP
ncbi:hypothetical protein ACHAXA_004952 [Cyclostephanos tholiformis]|uniref:Uncharacterized protein n=1 Tax=Cyclostephanos tholiformis TaxID=382380 RepID=A0ABD3RS22_9STRA